MAWDGVRAAKAEHEAALFARANVVGVGIARKVVGGRQTDEPCVVVYVERKRPEAELARRDVVPKALEGVRTDVVETGRFRALGFVPPDGLSRTSRVRPAPGGVSIGHPRMTAGTLGVLARTRSAGPVILSNNHVLANSNDAKAGDVILQPGPADGGRPEDGIARLTSFVPLVFDDRSLGPFGRFLERVLGPLLSWAGLGLKRLPAGRTNLVDVALAEPLDPGGVRADILEIGRVAGTAAAEIGLPVRKSGRTTGLTSGRVTGLDAVVTVDYGGRSAVFRGQVVSDLPSKGGDSGSLIVDDANRAVGLLFAGSVVTTLLNPIDAVVRQTGIDL